MNSKIKFLSWALTALLMCANFTSCSDDDDDDEPFSSGDSSNAKPEAVDLGLPSGTLWATFNVGATSPEEYGDYFAWGELEPHYADGHSQDSPCSDWRDGYSGYDWANYKWVKDGGCDWSEINKYTIDDGEYGIWYDWDVENDNFNFIGDNKIVLDEADDVAAQKWGSKWRMPTYEQIIELKNNCYWIWTNNYNDTNVSGCMVYKVKRDEDKGQITTESNTDYKETDAHIFLPAAGCRGRVYTGDVGTRGYYWSRSLSDDASYDAGLLWFSSSPYLTTGNDYRWFGQSVRAVQRKN